MIQRDYILRMIEQFCRALAKLNGLKEQRLYVQAGGTVEEEARRLTGTDLGTLATLSDTEILSKLLEGGEFHAQGAKALMLARLFLEAADLAETEGADPERPQLLRLRALHLMLDTALRSDEIEWPEFVPTIGTLMSRLEGTGLPIHTYTLVMHYCERTGQYGKAEDALLSALDQAPENPVLRQLGMMFYRRLLALPESALVTGNLPRDEVEAGLEALEAYGSSR